MQSPELLILDDPFSGLDNASRALLREVIEELFTHEYLQILLLTSRTDEILEGLTHLLCVEDGKIIAQGEKASMLHTDCMRRVMSQDQPPLPLSDFDFPTVSHEALTQADSPLIELKGVSARYGKIDVLRQIDWTMNSGEHWAVLGHNGAGKSTLLSMILADNPQAYANNIRILGKQRGSGESIWDIKRQIGWVSPELLMYYHRHTACHAVVCSGFFDSIGLFRHATQAQNDAAAAWMKGMGLGQILTRPLSAVSAGEQRMVLLARALVKHPRLVILDEPCQGLDAGHRKHILNVLDHLCQHSSLSIIYVTHHFDELPEAISHVLTLEKGRISGCGRRQEVLEC